MLRYGTRQDAINHTILPALSNPDDFDVEAIAAEILIFRVDLDARGNELLTTAGFEDLTADAPEAFWAIVEKHAKSQ